MTLEFWKLTGAGNDFVVIDNLDGRIPADPGERAELVRRLCARRVGVGADGVLLVEPSQQADFRMRYYNSDGGEAETCGNGARCIARFAHLRGLAQETMQFETQAGLYAAVVTPEAVRVSMSDAHSLESNIPLEIPDLFAGQVDFVNTGVPHVVVRVEDSAQAPVVQLGRAIRHHERFAPAGANVNFISPAGAPNRLHIRTYERGVEDETLACGTGSIAAAIIHNRRQAVSPPIHLVTQSESTLTVRFEPTPRGARDVTLEGEARVVYRAELA